MWTEVLRVSTGVSEAAWLAPCLHGEFGAVGRTVARGYGVYARICHPAEERGHGPASWTKVADAASTRPGRRHALADRRDLRREGVRCLAGPPDDSLAIDGDLINRSA
jgi:hypothetical protein